MSTLQIIDNFLPNEIFEFFAMSCMSTSHYTCLDFATSVNDSDGSISRFGENLTDVSPELMFQAVLLFGNEPYLNYSVVSDFYLAHQESIKVIQEKLNAKRFCRIIANCTVKQPQSYTGRMHTDVESVTNPIKPSRNAILYLNTNNGGTLFKDGSENGIFVKSKKNRCVLAPIDMEHAGVWQTDAKLRFVLNINYINN